MRKWLFILAGCLCWACVGQKDDPEPLPEPEPEQTEDSGASEGTRFYHRVLAMDFTGSWCQYCPNMAKALKTAQEALPGRIVDIAVHAYDDMSPETDCGDKLLAFFKVKGFPSMVMDMDPNTLFNTQEASIITGYAEEMAPEDAPGLSTSWQGSLLSVSVKAIEEGEYKLCVAQVQDGLVAYQTGYGDNYVNHAVLRRYAGSWDGDSLGTLAPGEEATRKYAMLSGDYRLVIYVTKDGISRNALSCAVGENIAYAYEQDN